MKKSRRKKLHKHTRVLEKNIGVRETHERYTILENIKNEQLNDTGD
jgi:hypothetical protein